MNLGLALVRDDTNCGIVEESLGGFSEEASNRCKAPVMVNSEVVRTIIYSTLLELSKS